MSPSPIAHYKLTGTLGEGGMGAVYRATGTRLNRDVAIKVLPEGFAQDGTRMARFEKVSDALAAALTRQPDFTALPKDTPPRVRLQLTID